MRWRPGAIAVALALASPAAGAEALAVVAVAEPPAGPGPELAELAHRLRDACRDRAAAVAGAAELRERLLAGRPSLAEQERACAQARIALEAGDGKGAERRLRGALAALERAPESPEAFALWTEATARLAWAQRVAGRPADGAATLELLAASAPGLELDEVRYPPSLRAELEAARSRLRARPTAQLTVRAGGRPAVVFVNGRAAGTAPVTLALPPGRYRIGAVLGDRRLPPAQLELAGEDRAVDLDAALAEAVRPQAGPGLAVAAAERAAALVRLGAWLGARRVVAARLGTEDGAAVLEAALYDVPQATLRRAGRVRLADGAASAAQVGALASFLLGGPPSAEVVPVEPSGLAAKAVAALARSEPAPAPAAPEPGPARVPGGLAALPERAAPGPDRYLLTAAAAPPAAGEPAAVPGLPTAAAPGAEPPAGELSRGSAHPWARPAAYGSGAAALALAGFTVWQALSARSSYGQADAMLLPDGTYVPGASAAGRQQALADGDAATRNAYLGAAATVVLATAAVLFGHLAADERGIPVVRF